MTVVMQNVSNIAHITLLELCTTIALYEQIYRDASVGSKICGMKCAYQMY